MIELAYTDEPRSTDVSGHRQGPIRLKRLLQGEAGSPGNFELSVIRSGVGCAPSGQSALLGADEPSELFSVRLPALEKRPT